MLTITRVFNLLLELGATGGDMYESLRKVCPGKTMKERPEGAEGRENTEDEKMRDAEDEKREDAEGEKREDAEEDEKRKDTEGES